MGLTGGCALSGECSRAVSGHSDSELFWGGRALFCPWVLSSEGTLSPEEMFQPLADTWLPSCQGWARPPGCLPVTASPLLIHGLNYLTEEWVHLQPARALPCLSLSQGWCSISVKCEFKRHTPMVVSGCQGAVGTEQGRLSWQRGSFRTVYSPIPCNTLL